MAQLPDHVRALLLSLEAGSSGAVVVRTCTFASAVRRLHADGHAASEVAAMLGVSLEVILHVLEH